MRRVRRACASDRHQLGLRKGPFCPLLLLFALPITVYNSLPLIRERGREPVRRSQNEKGGGHVPVAITKGLWPSLLFALPITVYNSLPLIRERGREPVRRSQNEKGGGHVPVAITKGLWPREGHYLSFALALSIAYYFLLLTTTNQKEGEGANEEATQ